MARIGTTAPMGTRGKILAGACAAALAAVPVAAAFGPWSTPVSGQQGSDPAFNTEFVDGCPILSPDGLSLYMASNRPGGLGGLDIWVATRTSTTAGWGAPVNLGAPVNSAADDFCPTPAKNKRLFFVTKRDDPAGDIYLTKLSRSGYSTPVNLGPRVNSTAEEWSPSFFVDEAGNEVLYFSSTRAGGQGGQDIYFSVNGGQAQPAVGLNTAFDDARPNVRHTGKEIVFDSNRPGTLGGPDIWTSTRGSTTGGWRAPTHLAAQSSPSPDTRASLSYDGTFLLLGSGRPGGEGATDIYVATRSRSGPAGAN